MWSCGQKNKSSWKVLGDESRGLEINTEVMYSSSTGHPIVPLRWGGHCEPKYPSPERYIAPNWQITWNATWDGLKYHVMFWVEIQEQMTKAVAGIWSTWLLPIKQMVRNTIKKLWYFVTALFYRLLNTIEMNKKTDGLETKPPCSVFPHTLRNSGSWKWNNLREY